MATGLERPEATLQLAAPQRSRVCEPDDPAQLRVRAVTAWGAHENPDREGVERHVEHRPGIGSGSRA
jgi:hypothetical protein